MFCLQDYSILTSPLLTSSARMITDPGGVQLFETETRADREQRPHDPSYCGSIVMMSLRDRLLEITSFCILLYYYNTLQVPYYYIIKLYVHTNCNSPHQ